MEKKFYILFAAMGLLAGCSNLLEENAPLREDENIVKTVLTVGIEDATRTYLGDSENGKRKVYWSNGDVIALNGVASDPLEDLEENASSAQFHFNFDSSPSTPYNLLYPASIYEDETHVSLPAVQDYSEGGFAEGMNPMAGYSPDGSNTTLSHLCAIVKISILRSSDAEADTDNIACVRFRGRNDEQVSGRFTIDYENATLEGTSTAAADKEVRVVKNQATSTETAVEYFLVVPAEVYSNGFDVIVQDVNGHIMTKSKSSSADLVAGHLYNMPEFEFVPSDTELGVEISSAEELVAFATAYNNGDYADFGSSLIATVTAETLVFDDKTSADFNATGGIGTASSDNRFDGIFNGNNKTISGLESTVVLFNGTSSTSTIKDLNLDNTCSFTFTNPKSGNFEKGAIVGYHRGTLSNVKVAADVSLAEVSEVTSVTALGGLVGRIVVGSIENDCEYSGLISTPAGYSGSAKIMIGGLAGEITNAAGSISNSNFKGAISNEAQETEGSDQANPYLIIGGIVGQLSAGEVSSSNTTSDHETVSGAYSGSTGIIVNKTIQAYCSAVGGIVGENVAGTVSGCNNRATILVTLFKKDNSNANGRRTSTGGIVGINQSNGTVTGCTNYATVIHRANTYFQYLGGVVGRNYGAVTSCTNDSGALAMATSGVGSYSARYPHIGGVIAENNSSSNVSDLHNSGNITLSRTENVNNVYSHIGGVIGLNNEVIDGGATKNITNSGKVLQSYTPASFSKDGFNLGGIVGKTTAAVSNVSNSGTVEFEKETSGGDATENTGSFNIGGVAGWSSAAISGADNTGEVYFLNTLATAASTGGYNIGGIAGYTTAAVTGCTNGTEGGSDGYVHYYQYTNGCLLNNVRLGGIAGYIPATAALDIENDTNNGHVHFQTAIKGAAGTVEYHYIYSGGIVGRGTNLAFDHCTNNGFVEGGEGTANLNQANTVWVGGIVAYLDGASSINSCTNSGEIFNNHWANRDSNAYDGPLCGCIAGIVYGTSDSIIEVSGCTVTSDAYIRTRRGTAGTVVGSAIYASVTKCTSAAEMDGTGTAQAGYNFGGIAGIAQNSTISGCTYSGTTISSTNTKVGGGIVGKVLAGTTTIENCRSYLNSVAGSGNKGGVVGSSVAGTTITECHYTTAFNIAGSGSYTDGGGNAADL